MEKTEKVTEKAMENHEIFCNLKSTNPVVKGLTLSYVGCFLFADIW